MEGGGEPSKEAWQDAYWQYCHTDETTPTEVEGEVSTETTWREFDTLDQSREQAAKLMEERTPEMSPSEKAIYLENCAGYWDKFYRNNENKFFKDRHYLPHQFALLKPSDEARVFLECGCGAGNSVWPLLVTQPNSFFYSTDFSDKAVELVKANPQYDTKRCKAFVCDITSLGEGSLLSHIEKESVDVVLMIFVMSAIAPEKMPQVLQTIYSILKPGGHVLFRDYGKYDLTQIRFLSKKQTKKLQHSLYLRSDGTLSYYFSKEMLSELFQNAHFMEVENRFDVRELKNRKRKITMCRVWLTAVFRKPLDS